MIKLRTLVISLLAVLALKISLCQALIPTQWQTLAPGLEYTSINSLSDFLFGDIYAFRFNLQQYYLELAFTHDNNKVTTVPNLVLANHAVIGINGGFFSPDLKPLGLRINKGEIKNPIKATGWWGIFYTQGNNAYIVSRSAYKPDKSINFALQSGPRLIVNGKITALKPGFANRTALGIQKNGDIILVVTAGLPLMTSELAQIMQRPESESGLNCVDALNLDGGGSTQLYAQVGNFMLQVPGFSLVSDAVLVIPK